MDEVDGVDRGAGPPTLMVPADSRHGVTIAARSIAEAVRVIEPRVTVVGGDAAGPVHVHFTDRLWGATPEEAADRFEALAFRASVTVTLHDIPQPSDGPRNLPRRTAAYTRVVAAARGVVVNSRHESALLAEAGIATPVFAVIPLAIDRAPGAVDAALFDGSVAVLGFFYPGKGHDDVIDAVAGLAGRSTGRLPKARVEPPAVRFLGGVSPGHERELADLVAAAAARGVRVDVSGYLSDSDMLDACRSVAVPVVAHRHFSASGSLATWIAAGRRPLVVDSRYAREMAELRPGTMTIVEADGLADAIDNALEHPQSTLIAADATTAPGIADAARDYLSWWRDEVTW